MAERDQRVYINVECHDNKENDAHVCVCVCVYSVCGRVHAIACASNFSRRNLRPKDLATISTCNKQAQKWVRKGIEEMKSGLTYDLGTETDKV